MENLTHHEMTRVFSPEQSEVLAAAFDEMTSSRDYVDAQVAEGALRTTRWVSSVFLAVFTALIAILLGVFV